MGPEELKAIGEAVTYIVLGAGGLLTAQKVHTKMSGGDGVEYHAAEIETLERIEAKLDRMAGSVRSVKIEVEELSEDVQRQRGDITRLSSGFREVTVRVEALESRMQRPM